MSIRRSVVPVVLLVAATSAACGSDESAVTDTAPAPVTAEPSATTAPGPTPTSEPATTRPATTEPATTEPATTRPASTEPATTTSATTTSATTVPSPSQPAIWPRGDVVFDDPMTAATDYVERVIGSDASALGEFMAGDARSGEIAVRRLGEDGTPTELERSLLLLRRLGPDDGWFVLAAVGVDPTIDSPATGEEVSDRVVVSGVATGYEANLTYRAFVAGDESAELDAGFTSVGLDQAVPYELVVDLTDVEPGTVVVIHVEADDGLGEGAFSAVPVVVRG